MNSLIITVLNEYNNLDRWLNSILTQSILPDEIIIVDGGSTDGTVERLTELSQTNAIVKIFEQPGNISKGRNFAISKSNGDLIIVTDAGCIYDKYWLEKVIEKFSDSNTRIAATGFGPWLEMDDNLLLYLIAAATTPAPREFMYDWLPSSRSVAFKKELWLQVGGYPEWIPICEDIIFDLKIKKTSAEIEYIRKPLVFWRPRLTISAYFKQLYRYTKSDGHGKLWLSRQLIRYAVYIWALILLYLTITVSILYLIILFTGLATYMNKFWQRFFIHAKQLSIGKKFIGFLFLPFLVALGDVAKICGWPVGVYDRLTGKVIFEQY